MPSKTIKKTQKVSSSNTRVVRGKTEHSRTSAVPVFSFNKSYSSLLYGILTVLLIFGILFIGYKLIAPKTEMGSITPKAAETVSTGELQQGASLYTVQAGDTLWSISEKMYKTGFKWTDIAKVNKLESPENLAVGAKLSIPADSSGQLAQNTDLSPAITIEPTQVVSIQKEQTNTISGGSYTVQAGDDLWNIAIKAYGDGYKWVEIARANSLSNPDVIHSGNALKLPR